MRALVFIALLLPTALAQAEACGVYSRDEANTLQRCLQNRSIPSSLFRSGSCSNPPEKQRVEIRLQAQCPSGFWGVCRNIRLGHTPYRQDLYHYGSLTRHTAQRHCQQQDGVWMMGTPPSFPN